MATANRPDRRIGKTTLNVPVFGLGAAHQVALPAATLQVLLAHPAVASVIPVGATPDEVTRNLTTLAAAVPAAFRADLKTQGLIDPAAPVPA